VCGGLHGGVTGRVNISFDGAPRVVPDGFVQTRRKMYLKIGGLGACQHNHRHFLLTMLAKLTWKG
jgi:hypothetical protein